MAELAGTWTYRSFNPTLPTGNLTPEEDGLLFADAKLTMRDVPDPMYLEGTIEWSGPPPGGLGLNVRPVETAYETLSRPGLPEVNIVAVKVDIVGTGRRSTGTDGWEYRYQGHLMPWWPAVNQRPTLVGSVFRVKDHNGQPGGWRSPAGYVASFIAVKPQQSDRASDLTGSWTYLSFHNNANPLLTVFRRSPRELILQEAEFKLERSDNIVRGTIEWPAGHPERGEARPVLDIGIPPHSETTRPMRRAMWRQDLGRFWFGGIGRSGTQTDGWEYEYYGHLVPDWPKGIRQVPALVGIVIRLKPHGEAAPAGYVYPFIAVKQ